MTDLTWTPHRVRDLLRTRVPLCHWCDNLIHRDTPMANWNRATVDHICPREYGGHSDDWNLVLSCRRCNEARAAAGHCIAAVCCAVCVLGPQIDAAAIHRWYIGIRGPVGAEAANRAKFPPQRARA